MCNFIIPLNLKIITSNKQGPLRFFEFGTLINFQSLYRHCPVLLDQIPLQLDSEEIKEREDGERGCGEGGGRLFEGGDIIRYSHQKGAIIEGRRLIE